MSEVYLGTDVLRNSLCCNKITRCTKIVGFLFIFLPLNNSVKLLTVILKCNSLKTAEKKTATIYLEKLSLEVFQLSH